jgi:mannose-6-phosphate isomerase-like protein (cupin superfamily)
MKISYKNQSVERKNSEECVVTEYPTTDSELNFALVTLSGRYPPNDKRAVNIKSKEIVYIQNGTGKVVVDNIEYLLNVGDVVLIDAGEPFYWEGDMTLCISCTPAFDVEQHQIVD